MISLLCDRQQNIITSTVALAVNEASFAEISWLMLYSLQYFMEYYARKTGREKYNASVI